jgi:hypothetical protein
VNQPVSQSGALHVLRKIRQCVAESAENERLIVSQFALVGENLDECRHLGVVRVEVAGLFEKCSDVRAHLIHERDIPAVLTVARLHQFELIEPAGQDVMKQRSQTE